MDCKKLFKLDFSLEKLSLIALAVKLWNLPGVQERVKNYFRENKWSSSRKSTKWREILNYVIYEVNTLPLAKVLLNKVKNYLGLIGDKIHNWSVEVKTKHDLDVKHAEKIYWTSYGTVDDLRIVEEYWLKETELSSRYKRDYLKNPLFNIAASYAREDFIKNKSTHEMMNAELNTLLPKNCRNENLTVYGTLSSWLIFLTGKNKDDNLCWFRRFQPNHLHPETLFFISIRNKFRFAAKNYWEKIEPDKKRSLIIEAAEECFPEEIDDEDFDCQYNIDLDLDVEIVLFLLNEMHLRDLKKFVKKHFRILFKLFLRNWPYDEMCAILLDQNWKYSEKDIKISLTLVMKYLLSTDKRVQLRNKNIYRILFGKLLKRASKDLKLDYFVKRDRKQLSDGFKNFDPVSLIFILNDEDLQEHRVTILTYCEDIFKKLALDENYADLDTIIENVFSDEKKISWKAKLNFFCFFLAYGKIESADYHLIWLYDSEDDRLAAKREIDPVEMCRDLLRKCKCDSADKFLLWRLDTMEERKKVKKAITQSGRFLRDEIYIIWGSACDVVRAEEKCSELLNWCLESEEGVIEFKKSKIIENDFFVVKYWKGLFYRNSFQDFEDFLKFCLWTDEKIEEFKKGVRINILWWFDTFIISESRMLNALLDWIFIDADLKREIIGDYMISSKGALACISVFKKFWDFRDSVCEFFNTWFDESINYSDIYKLEKYLESYDEMVVAKGVKSFIITLLMLRREGEKIVVSKLPHNMDEFIDSDLEVWYESEESVSDN